jgi:5'-3' exonuclease
MMFLNSKHIGTLEEKLAFTKENIDQADARYDLVRHMVLNSLRMYRKKFSKEYGELILCSDGRKYWRKDKFPYYKASRKTSRQESEFDWGCIFDCMNQIKAELIEVFPYKLIELMTAEADDVIAIIVKQQNEEFGNFEKTLIISADKDFTQLHKYNGVVQYNPIQKKFISEKIHPSEILHRLIMSGDRSDGIPNMMSSDDTFVTGKRQTPLSKKKQKEWGDFFPKDFCKAELCNETQLRNYKRNQMLIDFDFIPTEVEEAIIAEYEKPIQGNRAKILDYFIEKGLRDLTDSIGDF